MYRRLARFAIIAAGATATGFTGYQAYSNNKRSAQTNFVDNSIPTLYSSTVVLTPPPPPPPSSTPSTTNKHNLEYYSGQLTIQQHIARNDTVITGELHKTSSSSASSSGSGSTTGEKHRHSQHQYRYPSAVRLQVVNPRTMKTGEGQAVNVTNVNVNVDYDEKSVQMNELVSVSQDGQIAHRMDGVTDLDGRVMLVKNERDQVLARGLIVEQVRPVSVHVPAQKL